MLLPETFYCPCHCFITTHTVHYSQYLFIFPQFMPSFHPTTHQALQSLSPVTGSCGLPPVDPGCCAFQGDHPTSRQRRGFLRTRLMSSLKSALAEYAWENHHPIRWEEATVIDQARTHKELLLKEVIHIRPQYPHLNRDGGLELPGCWLAALKGTAARVDRRQPATSGDTA